MSQAIPIVICFDSESDDRQIDPRTQPEWVGLERLVPVLEDWRRTFAAATGRPARYVWAVRADPGIAHVYGHGGWAFVHYRHLWDSLAAAGDDIGLHAHPWRWQEEQGVWLADYNEAWTEECLRLSHAAVAEVYDRPMHSFRYGDRYMNDRIMRTLEDLGVRYDLTIEPNQPPLPYMKLGERTTGLTTDHRGATRKPYRPSKRNFRRPGWLSSRKVWAFPMTTGEPLGHVHGMPDNLPKCQTLLLGTPFEALRPIMEAALNDRDHPYLAAIVRTDVREDPFNREQFDRALDFLATHPLRRRFVIDTPESILKLAG